MAKPATQSRSNTPTNGKAKDTPAETPEVQSSEAQIAAAEAAKKAEEAKASKEAEKQRKAQEKAEAEAKARQALIDAGDLIEGDGVEFTAGTKETKVYGQISDILDVYRGSDRPLVFATVVEQINAKYPEDLIPAMHALERLGLVRRFDAKATGEGAGNRRQAAYVATDALRGMTLVGDES